MTSRVTIEPITDTVQIESALSLVANVIEGPHHLNLSFLRSRNWAVVPVESGSHFIPEDAELLSRALHSIECSECLAIATELLKNIDICYWVPTSKEGLLDFDYQCALFNFALLSENISFVILCTVADYYLVAGQADFVTRAVGKSLQAARRDFLKFTTAWQDDVMRKYLRSVYKRYEPFNGDSDEQICK
jgi:hypothetical protein